MAQFTKQLGVEVSSNLDITLSANQVTHLALIGTVIGVLTTVNAPGPVEYYFTDNPGNDFLIDDLGNLVVDGDISDIPGTLVNVGVGSIPVTLTLSGSKTIPWNAPAGTVIGTLAVNGASDQHTFALDRNPGDYLTIVGSELRTAVDWSAMVPGRIYAGVVATPIGG